MKKPKYAVSLQAITYQGALRQSLLFSTSINFISYSFAVFSGVAPFTCWSTYQ